MRKEELTPNPEDHARPMPFGCLAFSLLLAGLSILLAVYASTPYVAILSAFALPAVFEWTKESILRARMVAAWQRRGIAGLLVYSESPHWQEYVEQEWLPRFSDRFVILNWSKRKTWRDSLEKTLFGWYLGYEWNYNPGIVMPRGMRRPLLFRFFYAFRDAKHGNLAALERLERRLFEELNLNYSGCTYTSFQRRVLEGTSVKPAKLERGN